MYKLVKTLESIPNAHQYLKHNDFLKDKCCIIQINNTNDLCFSLALVVARAYIRHLCFMQPVDNKQIEEEDVFETNDDDDECLESEGYPAGLVKM
uniref:Uncharacterized protein n=1 Tax=Romanomermis culicivorax TaxID=13658 RepID=A0A915IP53_ROMCU